MLIHLVTYFIICVSYVRAFFLDLFVVCFSLRAAAVDELMNGNGPEDLLLDELVRNIKWAAQQRVDSSNRMKQHHRFVQDDDLLPLMEDDEAAAREYDYILQQQYQQLAEQMQNNNNNNKITKNSSKNNKIQPEIIEQQQEKPRRPFAYRPSEAGYYDANSVRPQQQSVNPITQSAAGKWKLSKLSACNLRFI